MKNSKSDTHRFPSHSAYEWRDIIRRFESSSLKAEDFCLQESISMASFKKWRTHYSKTRARRNKSPTPDFIEIVDTAFAGNPPELISPVSPIPWDIELELGNGIICRMRKT